MGKYNQTGIRKKLPQLYYAVETEFSTLHTAWGNVIMVTWFGECYAHQVSELLWILGHGSQNAANQYALTHILVFQC